MAVSLPGVPDSVFYLCLWQQCLLHDHRTRWVAVCPVLSSTPYYMSTEPGGFLCILFCLQHDYRSRGLLSAPFLLLHAYRARWVPLCPVLPSSPLGTHHIDTLLVRGPRPLSTHYHDTRACFTYKPGRKPGYFGNCDNSTLYLALACCLLLKVLSETVQVVW